MSCVLYLQHDPVVIEIGDVPQTPPPDLDIIESHAHPPPCERVSHVVGVAQQKDPWGGQRDACNIIPGISLCVYLPLGFNIEDNVWKIFTANMGIYVDPIDLF